MESNNDKKLRIKFAPGVLESLEKELSPEELQDFMDQLKAGVEDGSYLENSVPVDFEELKRDNPEEYQKLMEQLENLQEDDWDSAKLN